MDIDDKTAQKAIKLSLITGSALILLVSLFLLTSDELPSYAIGGEDGKLGGEFSLQSVDGDVALSDYRGKVVVVYFGFTQCSLVCPKSMQVIANTINRMTPEEAAQVQPILVSFDTVEDTYEELERYVKKYHSSFIGVTGTLEQIDRVMNEYGAYYNTTDVAESDPGRAYQHSSRYYIIDQNGELVDAMRHSSTANEILARIRTLL